MRSLKLSVPTWTDKLRSAPKPSFNVLLGGAALWCLAILAAPVAGIHAIYDFFAVICHQDPARSWHILEEPLAVCIRCTSIYFAFLISLCIGLRANAQWLRAALILMIAEFVFAQFVVDVAAARAATGIFFGAAAAPFVKLGLGELREL